MLTRLIWLTLSIQFLLSCSALQTVGPVTERASIQNQQAGSAALRLSELAEIDTLIKLDNKWLGHQIEAVFNENSELSDTFEFQDLKLSFSNQYIEIKVTVNVLDDNRNVISATASGDILFEFRGAGLEWSPRFRKLEIHSRDFAFEGVKYIEADSHLNKLVLENFNSDFAISIVEQEKNQIPLSAVPLASIEVGASLPGFAQLPAQHQQDLKGIFIVAGSAYLIDSSTTTIALDMSFIPKLAICQTDVTVSRAEFVNDVKSREPVGIAKNLNKADDIQYFYSEISGAKRPMTIIHYWFADGIPIAVEELAVGPSKRWRTWSARGSSLSDASYLEVLVVEKESACILHTGSIHNPLDESIVADADQNLAKQSFETLQQQFNLKTASFSIYEDKPVIAVIAHTRSFLSTVLQASLTDLNIGAEFDSSDLSSVQYSANIQPFDVEAISCEYRDCPAAPACKANLTQCKRLRDTRDCSSCLFRNPLNNRCVSEAIDPLCEASRNRQNAKYDMDRATCIANAETIKQECDQLNSQALSSCQIESGFEGSACESVKAGIRSLKTGMPLAMLSTKARTTGTLIAYFSNFRIEENLTRLKLDMSLKSDLQQDGVLKFNPNTDAGQTLGSCISAWSESFKNRFSTTSSVNNLLSNFEETTDTLSVAWSGFGLSMETNLSPLESVFVGNPQLLANCKMGLTVNKVERALSGDDADYFRGHIDLEIQPLPTKIMLIPATIGSGENTHIASPQFGPDHLRYDFVE